MSKIDKNSIKLFATQVPVHFHILHAMAAEKVTNKQYCFNKKNYLNSFSFIHISKCKVTSFGRHADKVYKYYFIDNDLVTPIERVETIKNLGILMDEKLSFKEHIHDKINK